MLDKRFLTVEDVYIETAKLLYDIHEGRKHVYSWGLDCLTRDNPIMEGSLHLVGGKAGSGKTRFIRNTLQALSEQDKVLYLTIEDLAANFGLKRLNEKKGYNFQTILNYAKKHGKVSQDFFLDQISNCIEEDKSENLYHEFRNSLTLKELVETIDEYSSFFKIWVIDFLQAIKCDVKGTYEKTSEIAETLRAKTIEKGIAIIGVVQLSRSIDNILTDRPPTMNDIEGGGKYEQAANSVILLHRVPKDMGGYYMPTNDIYAYVHKNRLGEIVRRYIFNEKYQEIKEDDLEINKGEQDDNRTIKATNYKPKFKNSNKSYGKPYADN